MDCKGKGRLAVRFSDQGQWMNSGFGCQDFEKDVAQQVQSQKEFHRQGLLKNRKGLYFFYQDYDQEDYLLVALPTINPQPDYQHLESMALKGNKIRVEGKIEMIPANRPHCEVSQIGCREIRQLIIDQRKPLTNDNN